MDGMERWTRWVHGWGRAFLVEMEDLPRRKVAKSQDLASMWLSFDASWKL